MKGKKKMSMKEKNSRQIKIICLKTCRYMLQENPVHQKQFVWNQRLWEVLAKMLCFDLELIE
ncbi:hypothetical protein BpHYR1_007715 [Brachionus plicatilis]|uniref:Uncharacterized protein n=1 Tax=Brachionus plicatilis TaxID=10195 RepID=A0A3M7PRL1_BRAPC|nr:hypothetical protein BpHYR1_007715 [Brachionus plicatilis]